MEYLANLYIWFFKNILWLNILFAVLLVFFERRNPKSTMLWIMVLTFLPGLGFILYLFLGQDMSKKKMFQLKRIEDRMYRERTYHQLMDLREGIFKYENLDYKKEEDIIKMHILTSSSYFSQDNKIKLYFDGHDKFRDLIKSIESAKEYIYIEYYIIKTDRIGKEIFERLIEKANEGVEVKLLFDGMGGRKADIRYIKRLKDAGGEVEVFFPPLVPHFTLRINYRNHRKLCIIDGKEGYIGGFNIGDEYLGLSKKFGYWRDTHIKIEGSAINGLQWRFFKDWRFASSENSVRTRLDIPTFNHNENTGIQIVSSGPDSKWPSVKDGYLKMISNASERIYIQTPYFIPDEGIYEALRIAGLSGVDVRVMIPCKPDHPFVYWAGLSYMGELLEAGVRFYTYQNGFLHAKTFIMDNIMSSIGTANLDIRSFDLNFEVNSFIYDKEINAQMVEQFRKDLELSEEITLEKYRSRSNIVKIKESISRLLSPIL